MITASLVIYQNNRDQLARVINSIIQSSVMHLYVIDNSPTDELKSFITSFSGKIEYIFGQGNVGYGAAHNIGISKAIEAGATYHAVINPDIYFEKGTLETISMYMDAEEEVGQVMPKIVYPNGELQYLCKLIPGPFDLIFKRFLPSSWGRKRLEKFQLRFCGYTEPMNVPYLSGCFMFFRVEALKKVGLFDERFFMYPEDIDLTRRMHEHYKTMFYPYVTVVHDHAAASYKSHKMLKIHIVNMIKYFNKWGWIVDRKRSRLNKRLLENLNYKKQ